MASVCLSLTGKTIEENLAALERYRDKVDLVELRVDWLEPEEQFLVRSFPALAGLPTILAVRRRIDCGVFDEGEGVRLVIIAKALTYARSDNKANFAFVELEDDFRVPSIEDTCRVFGTRIIRSRHFAKGMPDNLDTVWNALASEQGVIPKLAVTPRSSADLASLISWAKTLPSSERIIVGMGDYGYPTRILSPQLGSMFSYSSALSFGMPMAAPGHFDPEKFADTYRGRESTKDFMIYALAGGKSIMESKSPALHNAAFREAGIDAVYVPFPSDSAKGFLDAIEAAGARGAAVTIPLKESIIPCLCRTSPEVDDIGACNTIVKTGKGWEGFNTDASGFERSLLEFLGRDSLEGMRATLVGAGGAAKAVALVLARQKASCVVLNRSVAKAKALAKRYGFLWGPADDRSLDLVTDHSDLVIQGTSVGMTGGTPGDPLEWYEFQGHEAVFDIIYRPERTELLARAEKAGCRVINGYPMLCYQAADQFRIWTGLTPPEVYRGEG
ncbi:MAG: shikimate dehydrogenase [Rectinemataceae bacterium]|nr:shikimate dehydrogenase [Rectinemataceae bacterium]